MLGLAIAYPCIDSAIEWQGIFLGSVHGYIKTIFLNNSKILVNRVVWLFRGNLEGLLLGLIPGRAFSPHSCRLQMMTIQALLSVIMMAGSTHHAASLGLEAMCLSRNIYDIRTYVILLHWQHSSCDQPWS